MSENTRIIEINGIKMEVDLRHAVRIDHLKIGDRVKCLVKTYSDFQTCAGVIVGFEPFKNLPGIVVAYLDTGYASGTLKFKTFNAETKDFEIVSDLDNNALEVDKTSILATFDREAATKRRELEDIEAKRAYFLAHFGRYFEPATVAA